MSSIVIVLTTVPSEALGEGIGRALVNERLAACVNIGPPMTSIYRWNENIERETERQLVIKTTAERVPQVERRIKELHSYELPEFLVLNAASGSREYLGWVEAESQVLPRRHDDHD